MHLRKNATVVRGVIAEMSVYVMVVTRVKIQDAMVQVDVDVESGIVKD